LSDLTTDVEVGYVIEKIPPIVEQMRRGARLPAKS